MRRNVALVTIALFAGAAAAGALGSMSKSIPGTRGNDVLRGTAGNDTILGFLGNDKLYGLAGNDFLDGGRGIDLMYCGPGRDTAIVKEKGDKASKDCEIVSNGTTSRTPPPSGGGTTTTGPVLFRYSGTTSQGKAISFSMTSAIIGRIRIAFDATCTPAAKTSAEGEFLNGASVNANGSFTTTTPRPTDPRKLTMNGTFDAARQTANGTLQVHLSTDNAGTHYECDTGSLTWTVSKTG